MESRSELSGTRAWIVVPRRGCDSIESVPFRSFSRSSMLIRPSPRLAFAASLSKPRPESLTVRCISPDVPPNRTSMCRAPLCFAELCRASCSTRKKQREVSGGIGLGKSWIWKSISTLWCSPNSWQPPPFLSPAAAFLARRRRLSRFSPTKQPNHRAATRDS